MLQSLRTNLASAAHRNTSAAASSFFSTRLIAATSASATSRCAFSTLVRTHPSIVRASLSTHSSSYSSSSSASSSPSSSCTRLSSSPSTPLHHTTRRHKSCGIVGLPNVGKSTLFNALTDTQLAEASNYPFCTIEPNTASVSVPDPILNQLAAIAKTDKIIQTQVKFVDIAGIIKGASEGAGLGNKFLKNIKDVDTILHVIRCFENPDIIHVDSRIDPIADMAVIEMELMLADLQQIEKRIENMEKNKNKKENTTTNSNLDKAALYKKIRSALNQGIQVQDVVFDTEEERAEVALLELITNKPIAYVCNVDESSTTKHNQYTQKVFDHVEKLNQSPEVTMEDGVRVKRVPRACLRVCSQLESEVQSLGSQEARKEFLAMNDLAEGSLLSVIQTSNRLLKSIKYYTVGVQEARAWSIEVGTNAQAAAGKIHSDLSKGFVCAEVIKPADFIRLNGDVAVRQAGLMKSEGKTYIVQDGDIIVFRVSGQKGR